MIKLMIVDDEAVIRQGLRKTIDWDRYGIEIACEAKSGHAALEKALQTRPDIVISDIRMGEGDGIELARRLLEAMPQVKIIMLSGYSDAGYMLEAIKLGVRDYLLKPAGSERILQSVLGLRDEILRQRQREQQNTRLENLVYENIGALKSHFFQELFAGGMQGEQAAEKARSLQIELPGPAYGLFMIAAKPGHDWELLQMLPSLLEPWAPVLYGEEDGRITAILSQQQPLTEAEGARVMERAGRLADTMLLPCLCPPGSLEGLPAAYEACREMMMRSIWFEGPVLQARAGAAFQPLEQKCLLIHERNIVQGVRAGDHDNLIREIHGLFTYLAQSKPTLRAFEEIMLGIARSIQVFSDNAGLRVRLKDIFSTAYTVEMIKETMLSLAEGEDARYGPQVNKALRYMREHCTGDLTLTEVGNALYISASYLTRLLKSKTGRGFHEWLHILRIEKARELLENTNLRHYEIAEQVGYRSYKAFSEYFNKLVGCSARTYRAQQ